MENIQIKEFEIDRSYKPILAAPIEKTSPEASQGKERIFNLRGTISENAETELKKLPCIAGVWTDAIIEPADKE
jgi:hypothetical protein